jgi:hypothetical protein
MHGWLQSVSGADEHDRARPRTPARLGKEWMTLYDLDGHASRAFMPDRLQLCIDASKE